MNFVERLETRRLLTTVAEGFPGFFEVTGTEAADIISISINQSARTFSLDGVTYSNVSFVTIYGLGGNDTLAVFGGGGGNTGASIVAGEGEDDCTLNGLGGAVRGDGGSDIIRVADSFRGEAYGGGGNDHVILSGSSPDLVARGGDGNDTLNALNSLTGVVMFGEGGNDRLYGGRGDDQLYGGTGDNFLSGGPGHDEFHTENGLPDDVLGGDGFDTLFGDAVEGNVSSVENIITP